jgi:hypothetical protein
MTSYFAGKSKVSFVAAIFGNTEVDMAVGYVVWHLPRSGE